MKIKIVHSINEVRTAVREARRESKRVGLVPTMGALHAGHGSLIEAAAAECDYVVTSIFVNPAQFGPGEDLEKYPRTLEADCNYCEQLGAHLVFAPSAEEMYPDEQLAWVNVDKLTQPLCGEKRPEHFRGVTTVCAKLFNIVQADAAFFGQKDAQQAIVIGRMVRDLNLPMEIRVCPIVREGDGLAMSSRNQYLLTAERRRAVCLHQALARCDNEIKNSQRNSSALVAMMTDIITESGGQVDYVEIVDADTLEPAGVVKGRILVALAVYFGKTRLIDNLLIDLNI